MGQSPKTYDVGADLTTEDRVLGDHNDESLVDDEKVLHRNVPCKTT